MSDVLGNLIERTLQVEPAVQPRLTSRFEAPAPRDEAARPSLVEEEVEREAPAPSRPRAARARKAIPAEGEDPVGGEQTPQRALRSGSPAARHDSALDADAPPERPHATIRDAGAEPEQAQGQRRGSKTGMERARDDAPEPPPAPAAPTVARQRVPTVEGVEPVVTFAPLLMMPTESESPELPASDERDGREPPAPVIRVSIGRVEVRATVGPAPPKVPRGRAPPASKVMSLDEYLSQRAKGDRR
jgi:hypothetical protein